MLGNFHKVGVLTSLLFSAALCIFMVSDVSRAASPGTRSDNVVAEVEGEKITSDEVDKGIALQISNLEDQIYNLKKQKLEAMINDRLLAKEAARQGTSVAALLDKEVTSKVSLVTEQEVDSFYEANKARIPADSPTVREQIRSYLQNQKLVTQREKFLQSLRSKAKVVVHLQPPPAFRVEVSINGAPFKGGAKAPVAIVKFEDFQCPFCKQVQATFAQLLTRYGNKVKLVHRDFPIDSLHPQARKAAEAARCANEQGKFWGYHDKLYASELKDDSGQLKGFAKEVGLDVSAFDRCVASGKYKAAVQKDVEEGSSLGVTGTPAFFINGRPLSGAQPLESFARIIDEELTKGTAKASAQ